MTHPPQHFVELGCGCGSSLLPVLKANPTCRVTGTDLSPTAVDMFKAAAGRAGIQADRVSAFPLDATDTSNHSLAGTYDACSLQIREWDVGRASYIGRVVGRGGG